MADDNDSGIGRSQGRRKSRFPALADIPAGATLDFVAPGVNYKIPIEDFMAAMNLIGTLVQSGDPLGVPILDPQGPQNNIRNMEAGAGLAAAVSALNGLALRTDLLPSVGGVQTLINELTAPQFRSIIAGAGIEVSQSGDNIQISSISGAPVTTKTVQVDTINDFPAPVGGVITLDTDTEYFLINDITTGSRFEMSSNSVIASGDPTTITLTYTGIDAMFTASGLGTSRILSIGLDAAAGTLFDVSSGFFNLNLAKVVSCKNLALIDGVARVTVESSVFLDIIEQGYVFTGDNTLFSGSYSQYNMNGAGGTIFDIGIGTFDTFTLSDNIIEIDAAATFLSGAPASGNVNAGRVATVINNRIGGTGPITPLVGISPDDAQWEFQSNDLIKNTTRFILHSLLNNVTETVIAATDTPVLVAGTWTAESSSGFIGDANGRLTYTAGKPKDVHINYSMDAQKIGNGTINYTFYIALNGVIIANSQHGAALNNTEDASINGLWLTEMTPTDYIELWVENNEDTDNLIVSNCAFRVT